MFKKILILNLFLGTPLFAGKRMKQEGESQYDLKDQIGSLENFKKMILKNMPHIINLLDEGCFARVYYYNQDSLKSMLNEMLCEERTNKIISFSKILKFLVSFSPLEKVNDCLDFIDKIKDADETLEETGKNIFKTRKIIRKISKFTKSIGKTMHGGVKKIVKCFIGNKAIKPLEIFNKIKYSIAESKEFVDFLGSIYENMDEIQQHEVWQTLVIIDEETKKNEKIALTKKRIHDFFHHFSNPSHKSINLNFKTHLLTTRSGLPIDSYTLSKAPSSLDHQEKESVSLKKLIFLLKKVLEIIEDPSSICQDTDPPACKKYLEDLKKDALSFVKTKNKKSAVVYE